MSSAAAPSFEAADAVDEYVFDPHGAQSLLQSGSQKPNYPAQIGAIAVYALLLGGVVTLSFKTAEAPVEEQQVIELAPMPVEEPPPEDTPPPLEELTLPDPPPPPLMDPIAPVEEMKPAPKPEKKPIPKVEKKVETPAKPRADAKPAPTARPNAAARTDAPAVRAPAAPPGATPSAIANHFHACMQRAAANAYPESQAPRTAHVGYRASFSATGSLTSFSVSSSGNGAFDAVANRLGSRCGSVPAPGKPVSLSGSITFSP
ncbi:energy transducer TonB [Methylocystis sp. S23]|jgi:protein TonB